MQTGVQKPAEFVPVVPFRKRKLPLFHPPSSPSQTASSSSQIPSPPIQIPSPPSQTPLPPLILVPPSLTVLPQTDLGAARKDSFKPKVECCISNAINPAEVSKYEENASKKEQREHSSDGIAHLKRNNPVELQTLQLPVVSDSQKKVELIKSDLRSSSNVSIPAQVSRVDDLVEDNVAFPGFSLLETICCPIASVSESLMDRNEKIGSSGKSACEIVRGGTDLRLAFEESSLPKISKEFKADGKTLNNVKCEAPMKNVEESSLPKISKEFKADGKTLNNVKCEAPMKNVEKSSLPKISKEFKANGKTLNNAKCEAPMKDVDESSLPKISEFKADEKTLNNVKCEAPKKNVYARGVQMDTKLFLKPSGQDIVSHGVTADDETLDPSSWNLGLTGTQKCNSNKDNSSKRVKTFTHANRSLWDLNTTMDTWEGSNDKIGAVNCAADVGKLKCNMNSVVSVKELPKSVEGKSKCIAPRDHQNTVKDLLNNMNLSTSSGFRSGSTSVLSPTVNAISALPCPSFNQKAVLASESLKFSLKLVDQKNVKPEPSDLVTNNKSMKLLKPPIIKPEPLESHLQGLKGSPSNSSLNSSGHANVKSEPFDSLTQDSSKLVEAAEKNSEHRIRTVEMPRMEPTATCSDTPSGLLVTPLSLGLSCSSLVPASMELSISDRYPCTGNGHGQVSEFKGSGSVQTDEKESMVSRVLKMSVPQTEHASACSEAPTGMLVTPLTLGLSCSSLVPASVELSVSDGSTCTEIGHQQASERKVYGSLPFHNSEKEIVSRVDEISVNAGSSKSKLAEDINPGACMNTDIAESDKEKINLVHDVQDECSSVTEEDSDGDLAVSGVVDTQGKRHGRNDDDIEDGEVREQLLRMPEQGTPVVLAGANNNEIVANGCIRFTDLPLSESNTTVTDGFNENENVLPGSTQQESFSSSIKVNELLCSRENVSVEIPLFDSNKHKLVTIVERKQVDDNESKNIPKKELVADGKPCDTQEIKIPHYECGTSNQHESAKKDNSIKIPPTVEAPGSSAEGTTAIKKGVGQRRIINLPRGLNGPPQDKLKSVPIRNERPRFNGVAHNGDKFNPRGRGSRDDSFMDVKYKFRKQSEHNQAGGSNGTGFVHGRRRVDNKLDSSCVDWNSDREFVPENYNGSRFSGHRGGFIASRGAGRGRGRKPMSDENSGYCHPQTRRRSPVHGLQIIRRTPRDISPARRCINEEKFTSGLLNEVVDPLFLRPQFQRLDESFVHRDGSFSPIQRRGPQRIPQVRSKSPPISRARSPGSWVSSRRRSPDGFGHQELVNHRSPQFYRIDKVRTQQHPIADEIIDNLHNSPPYTREMGSSRDPDRPRKYIPNRNRILPRTRRFEMASDPLEEAEDDSYFAGPMPTEQFHDLGGNAAPGERQGPARTFRAPYNGGDEIENFRFHMEDGLRYRICSEETNTDFQERPNLRPREFERRNKLRPGNPIGRTRNIKEEEENYRQDEQVWEENGFEEVPRGKRRRF